MTNSIQLDFNHEMTFGNLADLIEPYKLQAKLVELVGPGGGNPSIELIGTYKNIVSYLNDYTDGTDEDMKFFVDQIN